LLSDTMISLLESSARAINAAGNGPRAARSTRDGAVYSSRNYHTDAVRWSVLVHRWCGNRRSQWNLTKG
jgi:hypothetical protein